MSYRIDYFVEKIISPVVLQTENDRKEYENGEMLYKESFSEPYLVERISVENGSIVLYAVKNVEYNETNWSDKKVSLFDGD